MPGCNCQLGDGLQGLLGTLAAGSQVSFGFAYESAASRDDVNAGRTTPAYIQQVIIGEMLEYGIFTQIQVDVKEPWLGGALADGYITVKGITAIDQPASQHLSTIVERTITQYLPWILITRRDPVVIEYVPAAAQAQTGYEQANIQQYFPLPPQQAAGAQCDWNTQSFGDYVACQLGLTSPIAGVSVGAVGALVGVGIVLLAVALLRR